MSLKGFSYWEMGRLANRTSILFILGFLIVGLGLMEISIISHKESMENLAKFQDFEQEKVQQFTTMSQYGTYGFRLIIFPSSLEIFSLNSGVLRDFSTFIDSGERLKLYKPFTTELKKVNADYSKYWIVIGSLLFSLYGYRTFKDKKTRRFFMSITGKKAFTYIVFVKSLMIFLFTFALFIFSYILAFIQGLKVGLWPFLSLGICFYGSALLFFFLGMLSSYKKGIGTLVVIWFCLVFVLPVLSALYYTNSYKINLYGFELEKMKIVMEFERLVLEKMGRVREDNWNQEEIHKLYNLYIEKYFPRIIAIDRKIIDSVKKHCQVRAKFSVIIPTLFFSATVEELSGNGSLSMVEFYEYSLKIKQRFFKHFAQEKYFGNNKPKVFIKNRENVFYGRRQLPINFKYGLFLNLFYLAIIIYFSYRGFISEVSQAEKYDKPHTFNLKSGKVNFFITKWEAVRIAILSFFEGKTSPFSFNLDDQLIQKRSSIYLPTPEIIPANANYIHRLLFGLKNSNNLDKADVLFHFAAETGKIIILDEFFSNLSPMKVQQFRARIKAENLKVLVISGDYYQSTQIAYPPLLRAENDRSVDILKEL